MIRSQPFQWTALFSRWQERTPALGSGGENAPRSERRKVKNRFGPCTLLRDFCACRKVAIIERKRFGGTCVNNGCIPGFAHERWGEAPHAFVVLKEGAHADERELCEFARRIPLQS